METLPKFNVNAMRMGWYADKYFLRTQEILSKDNYDGIMHYQYFPRKDCVICGIPHVIDILKNCIGYYKDREKAWIIFSEMQKINPYQSSIRDGETLGILNDELDELWVSKIDEVKMFSIKEGSEVKDMEPVIGLIGNPKYFAHLETSTLGVLASQSAIATSVRRAMEALKLNQDLLFFPARFKHYVSQASDGYSAVVGGVTHMSTDSNGEYWGYTGIGTVPHLLIAAYGGDTAKALLKFDEYIDPSIDRVMLVDWDNDVIGTSVKCISSLLHKTVPELESYDFNHPQFLKNFRHHLPKVIGKGKGKLFGVRFDTSGSLVDNTFKFESYKGVCPELVKKARFEFDELGLQDLKIIVSGGFTLEKIKHFNLLNVPVDIFGIGSSIVNNFNVDFTADAVTLNGKHNAKVGREIGDWSKMNPELV